MDDNFNFDHFMDGSDEFINQLEEWKERMIVAAINTNYHQIEKYGIDPVHLTNMTTDELKNLNSTLQIMIDHFQDLEEYEKCKVLFDNLKNVEEALVK